jgi:AcrR family transcriptional regulator
MVQTVKTERVQSMSWRQQQAQATRDRIAEAARRLFAEQGYGATSIEAIAAEAGVATRTVYSAFGAKREILSHICEMWLERARARETAQAVLQENNPRTRIRLATGWLTKLYAAGFDVVLIFEAATDESSQTRELLHAKLAGRDQVMDAMIAALGDELAVSLSEAQAIFRALAAPGLYRELVEQLGWTPHRLADWMSETLQHHLLRAP